MDKMYYFYDSFLSKGNKMAHSGRLWQINDRSLPLSTNYFKWEASVDFFLGFLFGDFPYFEELIYEAAVQDINIETSLNLTLTLKAEVLNSRFEVELDLVPFMAKMGAEAYTTARLADNCLWIYYQYNALMFTTKFRKNLPTCGMNFK